MAQSRIQSHQRDMAGALWGACAGAPVYLYVHARVGTRSIHIVTSRMRVWRSIHSHTRSIHSHTQDAAYMRSIHSICAAYTQSHRGCVHGQPCAIRPGMHAAHTYAHTRDPDMHGQSCAGCPAAGGGYGSGGPGGYAPYGQPGYPGMGGGRGGGFVGGPRWGTQPDTHAHTHTRVRTWLQVAGSVRHTTQRYMHACARAHTHTHMWCTAQCAGALDPKSPAVHAGGVEGCPRLTWAPGCRLCLLACACAYVHAQAHTLSRRREGILPCAH